jgi:hypothetical protein
MGWLDPLRNSVVGLDTAPIIYFIEKNPLYLPIMREPHRIGFSLRHSEFEPPTTP